MEQPQYEMTLTDLWYEIEDLTNMIGGNEHPDDYVMEREDLIKLRREWRERTAAEPNAPRMISVITEVRQRGTTRNGNLTFTVILHTGARIHTEPDAAVGSRIENSEYRNAPVWLTLRDGRLIGVERVDG